MIEIINHLEAEKGIGVGKTVFMDTKSIVQNAKDISLEHVQPSKVDFCSVWPQAKKGLELLQGLIKNPIAKAAVGIVIAAGDAVSKSICGTQ